MTGNGFSNHGRSSNEIQKSGVEENAGLPNFLPVQVSLERSRRISENIVAPNPALFVSRR
jgi:hypothetical protein